jgi:hypothetical protein
MKITRLKSAALAATTIAVAMSVGFAAPASAMAATLTADKSVVQNGEGVTFTATNISGTNYAAFFIDGEYWDSGAIEDTPNPFTWDIVEPCASVDVTYRIYNYETETADYSDAALAALFGEPYVASVDVEFAGDNTVECDDTWGAGASTGSDEPLATTGSDASTVAGLTGVAGVMALAVAVAVARRSRRAQR